MDATPLQSKCKQINETNVRQLMWTRFAVKFSLLFHGFASFFLLYLFRSTEAPINRVKYFFAESIIPLPTDSKHSMNMNNAILTKRTNSWKGRSNIGKSRRKKVSLILFAFVIFHFFFSSWHQNMLLQRLQCHRTWLIRFPLRKSNCCCCWLIDKKKPFNRNILNVEAAMLLT